MAQTFTQLAPYQLNGTDDEELLRMLLVQRAEARLARFHEAMRERQELDEEIEGLRRWLGDSAPFFRDMGLEPIVAPDVEPATPPIGTAGNRSTNLPPRRERFAKITLADAVGELLADGEEWHADQLVQAIFDVQNHKQLRPAKATLASALRAGALKGRWDRVGGKGNTFRRKEGSMSGDS